MPEVCRHHSLPPIPPLSPPRGARSSGETSGRQTNRMPFGRRHACIADEREAGGWPRNCLKGRRTAVCPSGRRSRPTTPPASSASAAASALRKLNDTRGGIALVACFHLPNAQRSRVGFITLTRSTGSFVTGLQDCMYAALMINHQTYQNHLET